jgi:hypothetical protein
VHRIRVRIISGGIVCAFHTLLPPKVIVNETETRENELRGAEAGIWYAGEKNASPGRAVATVELQDTVLRRFAKVKACEIIYQSYSTRRLMAILCFRGIHANSRFGVAPLFFLQSVCRLDGKTDPLRAGCVIEVKKTARCSGPSLYQFNLAL